MKTNIRMKRLLALFTVLLLTASVIITDAVRSRDTADALQETAVVSEVTDDSLSSELAEESLTEESSAEEFLEDESLTEESPAEEEPSEESSAKESSEEEPSEESSTEEKPSEEEPVTEESKTEELPAEETEESVTEELPEEEITEEVLDYGTYELVPADDRSPGMPQAKLDKFADEAVYTNGEFSFQGLLSECWELAETNGKGTIRLIADVTAHAYDPAYYTGSSFVENGTTHTAQPHAITRFTGGLSILTVQKEMDIVLDLNGHTLNRNMDETDGTADRAYTVEVFDGGSFTLKDSAGSGKATGGYGGYDAVDNRQYGSFALVHSGGALTVDGAEISGNKGAGAVIGDGSVKLTGNAKILDNVDENGYPCNLVVSADMDAVASDLGTGADIWFTAAEGRETNAVSYPNGSPVYFTSDKGTDVVMEGGYIVLGEITESLYDAEWRRPDGTVATGTFDEMWALMNTEQNGTLKILKDLDLSGKTYTYDHSACNVTLDFNGHVIKAYAPTSTSQNFITIMNNVNASDFVFTDSTGRVRETRIRVNSVGEPSWDSSRRIFTYYESYVVDGGLDYGNMLVNEKVVADFSNLGGFDTQNYRSVIYTANGAVDFAGGAHRTDKMFIDGVWALTNIKISGGYLFDSGASLSSGSLIQFQAGNKFTMTGGTIAGCRCYSNVLSLYNDTAEITGGTFAQNRLGSSSNPIIYGNKPLNISNASFCNNSATVIKSSRALTVQSSSFTGNNASSSGGAIMIDNGTADIRDCVFVGNSAASGGGISFLASSGDAVISGCTFEQNKALLYGGGIYVVKPGSNRNIMIDDTLIKGNSGTGGGIYAAGSLVIGDNVTVQDNSTSNIYVKNGVSVSSKAGRITGRLYFTTESVPTVADNVLVMKYPGNAVMTDAKDHIFSDKNYHVHCTNDGFVYFSLWENGVVDEDIDAIYIDGNGEASCGSFDDMWALMAVDNSGKRGTLSIMRDLDLSGKNYVYSGSRMATIDFKGHVIRAEGSGNFITVDGNTLKGSLLFTDSVGKAVETKTAVDKAGITSWNETSRTYTFYETKSSTLQKTTADFSGLGGLDLKGYDRAVTVSSGYVEITGGAYRSDNGFLRAENDRNADSKVRMTGGYVFDSGNESTEGGGAFDMACGGTFYLENATVAGCRANDGGALRLTCYSSVTLKKSRIASCSAANDGGAFYQMPGSCSVISDSTVFSCNSAGRCGGALALNGADRIFTSSGSEYNFNSAADGGALYMAGNNTMVKMTKDKMLNNKAEGSGGAVMSMDDTSVSYVFSNVTAHTNVAGENGGVLHMGSDSVSAEFEGIQWYNNYAKKGGCLYADSDNITFGEIVRMEAGTGGGIYFPEGRSITLSVKPQTLRTDVMVENPDPDTATVIFQNPYKHDIMNVMDTITSADGIGTWSDGMNIYVGGSLNSDGVIVQHYANISRIHHSSSNKSSVELINTLGGVMPVNNLTTLPTINMYLNDDGSVLTDMLMTQVYANDYATAGKKTLDELTRFDKGRYTTTEVWILKDGGNIGSTNAEDWEVLPYTKGMELDLEAGSVIRFVAEQARNTWSTDVIFYDYDITDGGFYTTQNNATNHVSQIATSKQKDYANSTIYVSTRADGINNPVNYTGTGTKLMFGNANTDVDNVKNVWNSPTGKTTPNIFNRATSGSQNTFKGCTYGIVSGLDEDGNLFYSPGIIAPSLYGEHAAKGKYAYANLDLVFDQMGDTYTLQAVDGTSLTGLDKFVHPLPKHQTIWTNNFWPMDDVAGWGADGHDIKFGDRSKLNMRKSWKNQGLPISDDDIDHNAYFGFNFSIRFSLPEGYQAPLEYYFFGDDDMWVFLDGKLVCDIGGVHSAVGEYVNLWDYIEDGDTSEHEMVFFYTERGASGSTCWMQFTIPNIINATHIAPTFMYRFQKTDPEGSPIEGAEFTLYEDEECTKPLDVQYSEEDGSVTFANLEGGTVYCLKETKTADSTWIRDDTVYVLSQDEDGVWFMHKPGDTTPVDTLVNHSVYRPLMPNSGGIGRYVVYAAAAAAGLLCIIAVITAVKRRRK